MHIPIEVEQAVLAAEKQQDKKLSVSTSEVVEVLHDAPATKDKIVKNLVEKKTDELFQSFVNRLMLDYPRDNAAETTKPNKPQKESPTSFNLVELLRNTQTHIDGLENAFAKKTAMKHLMNPFMLRPGAYIAKIIDLANAKFEQVNSLESLEELFNSINHAEIRVENFYYGTDKKYVKLLKVPVPSNYVVSVSSIKLKDIPRQYFHDKKITLSIKQTKKAFLPNRLDLEICCEEAKPILSIQPGMEEYQIMSIKIDKKTNTILSWMPGAHPKHFNHSFLQEHTCVLGKWA
jgi:hypothetical protein